MLIMVPSCLTQASSKANCLSRPFPVLNLFWLFLNLRTNTDCWAAPVQYGLNFLIPVSPPGATSGMGSPPHSEDPGGHQPKELSTSNSIASFERAPPEPANDNSLQRLSLSSRGNWPPSALTHFRLQRSWQGLLLNSGLWTSASSFLDIGCWLANRPHSELLPKVQGVL